MSCKCAKYEEDENRYYCDISGDGCMFMSPDSERCAEVYGEGPDVENERGDNKWTYIKRLLVKLLKQTLNSFHLKKMIRFTKGEKYLEKPGNLK